MSNWRKHSDSVHEKKTRTKYLINKNHLRDNVDFLIKEHKYDSDIFRWFLQRKPLFTDEWMRAYEFLLNYNINVEPTRENIHQNPNRVPYDLYKLFRDRKGQNKFTQKEQEKFDELKKETFEKYRAHYLLYIQHARVEKTQNAIRIFHAFRGQVDEEFVESIMIPFAAKIKNHLNWKDHKMFINFYVEAMAASGYDYEYLRNEMMTEAIIKKLTA